MMKPLLSDQYFTPSTPERTQQRRQLHGVQKMREVIQLHRAIVMSMTRNSGIADKPRDLRKIPWPRNRG